jgi:hypothetical protein
MSPTGLSRRRLTATTSGVAAAVTLVNLSGATTASAGTRTWKNATSKNGWPVLDDASDFTIEGSGREVPLAEGDAATILPHMGRRHRAPPTASTPPPTTLRRKCVTYGNRGPAASP